MNTERKNADSRMWVISDTLVPHSAFERGRKRLEQRYQYALDAREPTGIAIIGESRTGKSTLLDELQAKHPTRRTSEGLQMSILRVSTQANPTVKGLAGLMLGGIEDPKWDSGTENSRTSRLITLMRNAGTRMVAIDEFQHFYDKASHKVMHHVADWLKNLVNDTKVALIVAGLPSCNAVLDQNEQLRGRFRGSITMRRFDWDDSESRSEFIGILEAFHGSVSRHFDLPKLDSDEMAFRCYCATGGLIGYLTKFLQQAVEDAIDEGRASISLSNMEASHDDSIWNKEGIAGVMNPFSRRFDPTPSEDLLRKIAQIGIPVEPVLEGRRGARPRKSGAGASVILSGH